MQIILLLCGSLASAGSIVFASLEKWEPAWWLMWVTMLLFHIGSHLTPRAADVCPDSSDGVHEWYQGSVWRECAHCGTRR